jgi:hypothetical protein
MQRALISELTATIMNVNDGRNGKGQFLPGRPGGPGRPPIARERKYMETISSVCTDEDWREICERAIKDAKDGDHKARDWLSKYLLGDPVSVAKVLHAHVHAEVPIEENPYVNASTTELLEVRALFAKLDASCARRSNGA